MNSTRFLPASILRTLCFRSLGRCLPCLLSLWLGGCAYPPEHGNMGTSRPTHPPRIPAPSGFVDSRANPNLQLDGLPPISPEYLDLGTFIPTNKLTRPTNDSPDEPFPYCRALFLRQFPSAAAADQAFVNSVAMTKRDVGKSLRAQTPFGQTGGRSWSFYEADAAYAFSLISTTRTAQGQVVSANASALIRQQDQLLMLTATYPSSGAANAPAAERTISGWIRAIEKLSASSNTATPAKRPEPDAPIPSSKQQRLADLIDAYSKDRITAKEYLEQRQKILAEP